MAPNSPVFLDVDNDEELEREPNVRRARSNGHLDFLQDQEIWNRRDQGLQMTRYHNEGGYYGASQQRTGAKHLAVPTYETSSRRQRASSDTHSTNRSARHFNITEVRPNLGDPVRHVPTMEKPREKPSAPPPLIIHQHPSISSPIDASNRSRNASPISPPQLQHKYALLQQALDNITSKCQKYINVEGASPADLTFQKICDQVEGLAFDLKVWHHVCNIQNIATAGAVVAVADTAALILDRMIERAAELRDACSRAKPGDLKFAGLDRVDAEEMVYDLSGCDDTLPDTTDTLGYIITSSLHSLNLQTKSLKRLTRSLQDETLDAKPEVDAVAALVGEVVGYFGGEERCGKGGNMKFAGRRALEEARGGEGR